MIIVSAKYAGVRPKTGWLEIRIMCQSQATCLPADICFSELALWKINQLSKCIGLVQSGLHHLIEI